MRLENTLTINADADRCWHILSDEFADIHAWSAGVAKSYMKAPGAELLGNTRTCEIPGFGTIQESVTKHDTSGRVVSYVITGMPSFVKNTSNTWFVKPSGPGKALVGSIFEFDTNGLLGKIMGPMLKRQLSKGTERLLEELKVYAETGEVHARTLKARKKQAA